MMQKNIVSALFLQHKLLVRHRDTIIQLSPILQRSTAYLSSVKKGLISV